MKSRSGALLKSVIERGGFSADYMASELSVTREEIDAFVSDESVMPLPRQLCLALWVIAHTPQFARRGHTLRAQVAASMAFKSHATGVHSEPPGRWI